MTNPTKEQIIQKRIGARMRQARDRAGISGPAACEALGISRRTLHSWEDGDVAQPAHAIVRMVALYRCSAEWMLGPDEAFFALIDPAAERAALEATDFDTWDECAQIMSVGVSDRLEPMTSRVEYNRRLNEVGRIGDRLRRLQ